MEDKNLTRFYELLELRSNLAWYQFIKGIILWVKINLELDKLHKLRY